LSKEFGWTYEQIRNLTLQEFVHSFEQLRIYRQQVPTTDVTLERIRLALFGFFGIKDKKPIGSIKQSQEKENRAKMAELGLPSISFTTAEKEAWLKAGMPNIGKFLKEYRAK